MIFLKTDEEVELMRESNILLGKTYAEVAKAIRPGVSTAQLDKIAYEFIMDNGGVPACLGYEGYPASICASIDDEVVHGIPSENVEVQEGSIISIDVTLSLDGWQADSAFTCPVGKVSQEKLDLIRVTEECFWRGAAMAINGNRIGDIGAAVQAHAEAHRYGVVRDLTGHGIGRSMHEDPSVPNFGFAGHGVRLRPGMTFCIEPMIAMGRWQVHQLSDGWTIVTNDHKPAAHYEHTIAVKPGGKPELLTLPGFAWEEEQE